MKALEKIIELESRIKKAASLKSETELVEITFNSYDLEFTDEYKKNKNRLYTFGKLYFIKMGGVDCYVGNYWNSDKFKVTDKGLLGIVDREKLIADLEIILAEIEK